MVNKSQDNEKDDDSKPIVDFDDSVSFFFSHNSVPAEKDD